MGIKVNISTRLLTYFLFVTILPLFFLALTSTLLLDSSLNNKLTQELDNYSEYVWNIYNTRLLEYKSSLTELNVDKLQRILATKNSNSSFKSELKHEVNNILEKDDFHLIFLLDKDQKVIFASIKDNSLNNLETIKSPSINFSSLINLSQKEKVLISSELISLKDLIGLDLIKNKNLHNSFSSKLGFLAQMGVIKLNNKTGNYYLFVGHILNKNSKFFRQIKDIYGANIIILQNNNVILTNSRQNISSIELKLRPGEEKSNNVFNKQILIKDKSYSSSIYFLKNKLNETVGKLIVSIPEEDFDALKLANRFLIFKITLLVALAGVTLAYLLARTITKPLSTVTKAAKAIEDGDLSTRVEIKSSDELGYLAQSFNNMVLALQKRKELEQIRDDLAATITHDLRVPLLASVQTLEQLLKGYYGELSEKQNFITEQLISNNKDLLRMVNTILDSYKYEAGKQTLIKRKINLIKLIEESISDIMPLVTEKNHELTFNPLVEKIEVTVDRQEIKRVLINILSNAITYTPENGIIEVYTQNNEDEIIVCVKDNGIGISESSIQSLFQRYSKGSKTLRKIGTGLGLYLSKHIVEAHNGKIWVESIKDSGSTFYFSIPLSNS